MSEQEKPHVPAARREATSESVLRFCNRPPVLEHTMPDGRLVYIHGLSDWEVYQWRKECRKVQDEEGREKLDDPTQDAKLLVRTVRDKEGKPLFTDANLTKLIELPHFVKGPMIDKAMKVCGFGARADEEILKNYAATLAGGS